MNGRKEHSSNGGRQPLHNQIDNNYSKDKEQESDIIGQSQMKTRDETAISLSPPTPSSKNLDLPRKNTRPARNRSKMGQGTPSNFNSDDLKKFTIYQLFQILNSQIVGLQNGGNPPPITKIMDENNLGPKRTANIEKSMSNISNDAGPFGQASGEDGTDGFTYDDMALTDGVLDSKRK